jgi:endoglucanase
MNLIASIKLWAGVAAIAIVAVNGQSAAPNQMITRSLTTTTLEKKMIPEYTYDRGCVVRGDRTTKTMSLIFTGGSFAEGAPTILDTLTSHGIKGGFFFTGDFLRNPEFQPLIDRIVRDGHYLGPHSDAHPLYASWDTPPKLLITRKEFDEDLDANYKLMAKWGVTVQSAPFFVPPYEHFTQEISDWTDARGMRLINMTTGTRTNADYMEDTHPRFVSAKDILKSVWDYDAKHADGLSGFMLLVHVGSGPERTRDKFADLFPELVEGLKSRGYSFERVDKLVEKARP